MRHAALVFVAVLALGVGGCGVMRAFFGVGEDGTTSDGSVAQVVGDVAKTLFPGPGTIINTLLLAAAGATAEYNRRRWKKSSVANAKAIDRTRKTATADGKVDVGTLTGNLATEQDKLGIRTFVKGVVSKVEAGKL